MPNGAEVILPTCPGHLLGWLLVAAKPPPWRLFPSLYPSPPPPPLGLPSLTVWILAMASFSRAAVLAALAIVAALGVAPLPSATALVISSRGDGSGAIRQTTTGVVSIDSVECAASAAHLATYINALTATDCGVAGAKADRLATASAGLATVAAGVAAQAAAGAATCDFNATEVAAVVAALEIGDLDNPCGLAASPRPTAAVKPRSTSPPHNQMHGWHVVITGDQPTPPPTACCAGTTLFDSVCCVDDCAYLVTIFAAWGMTMDDCCGNSQNHVPPASYCPA